MFEQSQSKQPTIREKLDYLEICNVATEHYNTLRNGCNERTGLMYEKQASFYKNLQHMIIEDLTKDPAFVNYCSNLSISANQQITTPENTPENSLPSNPLDDYGDKMLNEMLINERHYK